MNDEGVDGVGVGGFQKIGFPPPLGQCGGRRSRKANQQKYQRRGIKQQAVLLGHVNLEPHERPRKKLARKNTNPCETFLQKWGVRSSNKYTHKEGPDLKTAKGSGVLSFEGGYYLLLPHRWGILGGNNERSGRHAAEKVVGGGGASVHHN